MYTTTHKLQICKEFDPMTKYETTYWSVFLLKNKSSYSEKL